jgi:hypothetical protein
VRAGVVFLGQRADVISRVEQPLEQLARFGVSTCEQQRVDQPEAARQECTLAGWQPSGLACVS